MSTRPVNVAKAERIIAGFAAVALLASSIRGRHPLRLLAAGCLIYRAFSGHCYGYEWTGISTCKLPPRA